MASRVSPIPAGYHTVTPHLISADASRVIEFLKQVFDSTEIYRLSAPNGQLIHAELKIGDSMIMVAEASKEWKAMPASFAVYVEDADATYKRAVEAGAVPLREPANQFYGDRSGGVTDLAGNQWWIATHIEDVSPDEIKKRAEEWIKQSPRR